MTPKDNPMLTPSPYETEKGELVGRDPRTIPPGDLLAFGYVNSPMKAIRAKCVDCSGGNQAEARKCTATGCTLWPFRMGKNPMRGYSADEDAAEEVEKTDIEAAFA